jgi:hypothetical protein
MTTSDVAAQIARAEALVEAGDLDAARAAVDAVLADDPRQPGAHNVLGFLAFREGRLIDAQREFELACSLPGSDADARANLELVRRELASVYAAHGGAAEAPAAAPAPSPDLDFGGTYEELRRGAWGADVSSLLLGRLLAAPVDPELETRLDQLVTATTMNERRFLLRFAAHFWDGRGDVFENGPLLGGTTRALALGMLANGRREPGALLHTHDWFTTTVPLDLPQGTWEKMVSEGQITRAEFEAMGESGTFKPVFDSLHSGWDYSPLLRSHVAYLPDFPGDAPVHGEAIFEAPERVFSLVFVDGCKSWYGTKHWIVRMCDRVPRGSHFVFQDYGWYTCFWLPTLVGVLPDHFRLLAHVDDTYGFELLRELDPALVESRFPDDPPDLGRDGFDDIFLRLGVDAGVRSDVRSMVALTIQHAGALAYIGHKDEAREHIAQMRSRPEFAQFRARFIDPALRSPTYGPDGPIRLDD